MTKRFLRVSQPRTQLVLGNVPVNFTRVRISKLLMKSPVAFQDDSTHYLKINACRLEQNNKDVTLDAPRPYVFVLGFAGCANGYTTFNNCNVGCWDYECKEVRNEIILDLLITIDDQETVFDDGDLLLEFEFE